MRFDRPTLPGFLDQVTLRNLSLDGALLSVALRRSGDTVSLAMVAQSGGIQVAVGPGSPPHDR